MKDEMRGNLRNESVKRTLSAKREITFGQDYGDFSDKAMAEDFYNTMQN